MASSRSIRRAALLVLVGSWGAAPVGCGGRSSALGGDDFLEGGSGPISGGAASIGGANFGGSIHPGGRPSRAGFTGAGGAPGAGGGPTFAKGGRFNAGGSFTSGGAIGKGGFGGQGGFLGKGGFGGKSGLGGSSGWEGGAAGAGGTGETCELNPGHVVFVDPLAGSDTQPGLPEFQSTGVADPPHCRYRTLTHALSRVRAGGQVLAVNDGPAPTVTFKSESFPLTVPAGVTLSGLTGGPPERFQIAFTSQLGTAVVLEKDATLEGFTIHNRGAGSGTLVACSGQQVATLNQVILEGNQRIAVAASLGCTASVSDLSVYGAVVGVEIPGSITGPFVSIQGANIVDCGVGIRVSGQLNASGVNVSGSGDGVVVNSGKVSLRQASIGWSQTGDAVAPRGNGVVVAGGEVTLTASTVSSNAAAGIHVSGGKLILMESSVDNNGSIAGQTPTGSGVYVQRAEWVAITSSSVHHNTVHGLHLPSDGWVDLLSFDNSMLSENGQSGAQLEGQVRIRLHSLYSLFVDNTVSGMVFNAGIPLLDGFSGNRFGGNLASQLAFGTPSPTGTWRLSSPAGCSQPNIVSCYGGSSRGIVAAAGVPVDAGYILWNTVPPIAGQDFVGPVTVHDTFGTGGCDF